MAENLIVETEHLTRGLACIVLLGVTAQWLATILKIPSILLLLIFGFLAGPVSGILDPREILGNLVLPFVSISVALILYEGGLSLRIKELRQIGGVVRNLVTVGALITWLTATLAAMLCLGLHWKLSLLFGAILVVTGPTVIVPLLRHVRPTGQTGSILRWESIVIDSVGAILAVLTLEAIRQAHGGGEAVLGFCKAFLYGGGIGLGGAGLLYLILKNYLIPDYLQNAVSLMLVIAIFSISNLAESESGLIAVTIMGIALANQQSIAVKHIIEFKENLQVLLISSLFIILAAGLDVEQLRSVFNPSMEQSSEASQKLLESLHLNPGDLDESFVNSLPFAQGNVHLWTLLVFLVILVVLSRPLSVFISTLGSELSWRERVFLGFTAPRGIVAAAVSSVFAVRLAQESRERLARINPLESEESRELFEELFLLSSQAELLVPLTFITIVATVTFYGLGSPLLARWLKVAQPNPQGALIVGAHPLARGIAKALQNENARVLLADTNWANWQEARMEGLPIIYGNIITEYSLEELELGGVGRVLAMTNNDEVNSLSALHFSDVFGRANVYQFTPANLEKIKETVPKHLRGRYLFGDEITFEYLRQRWDRGARIKTTLLTDEFDFESYKNHHGDSAVPLFLIEENGKIDVLTTDMKSIPEAGKKVIGLVDPAPEEERAEKG